MALVMTASIGLARADDLETARKAVAGSDYMAARPALASALASGTAGPAELAEIYKLSGIVEAALGNSKDAQAAFENWLRLDPKGSLPPGTSPKITRPFDAAKSVQALKAKPETTAQPPTVTLEVTGDGGMVTKTRVLVSADGKPEKTIDGTGTIELPHGARLDLRIQGLDAHGNRVVELGSKDVPIVITGAGSPNVAAVAAGPRTRPAPRDEAGSTRPLVLRWWMWTGAAVAFGGAATYFGLDARSKTNQLSDYNAHSGDHTFAEAMDLEDKAKRSALVFNIGLGVAGAFAIGAVVLYVTEPHTETRISVTPVKNGGAVVFGGSF